MYASKLDSTRVQQINASSIDLSQSADSKSSHRRGSISQPKLVRRLNSKLQFNRAKSPTIAISLLLILSTGLIMASFLSYRVKPLNDNASKVTLMNSSAVSPEKCHEQEVLGIKALKEANYLVAYQKLKLAIKLAGGHPLDEQYGQLLSEFGQAARKTDHSQEAIDAFSKAQSIFSALNTPAASLLVARCKNSLGLVYTNQMDFKNAKAFLNEAKAIRDAIGSPQEKAESCQALAKLYNRFQSHDGTFGTDTAIKLLQDSLIGKRGDPAFSIESENDLGFSYNRKHEYKQARFYYQEAMQSAKENFGTDHPLYADSLVGLGTLNFLEDKKTEAQKQFQQALEIRKADFGENTIKTAEVYACLGYLETSNKNMAKAREYFERALQIKRTLLGLDNAEYKQNKATYHKILSAGGHSVRS